MGKVLIIGVAMVSWCLWVLIGLWGVIVLLVFRFALFGGLVDWLGLIGYIGYFW